LAEIEGAQASDGRIIARMMANLGRIERKE
jgi:hypothetical protein